VIGDGDLGAEQRNASGGIGHGAKGEKV